jgi:hypothetical protein
LKDFTQLQKSQRENKKYNDHADIDNVVHSYFPPNKD